MIFRFRRRCMLTGLALLLALPVSQTAMMSSAVAAPIDTPSVSAEPHAETEPRKAALASYIARTYRTSMAYARRVVSATFEVAHQYALPPNLLLAMMAKESGFQAKAYNKYGAVGLMGVVPRFHRERLKAGETERSLENPDTNIRVAADIFATYLVQHRNLDTALRKYSGSSRGYSKTVRANWRIFDTVEQSEQPG